MNQQETLSNAETAVAAATQATAPQTADVPAASSPAAVTAPTLQTTEKLLAEYFSQHLPKDIVPAGLHLNLSVHLHEGKENLNFTFTAPEGFGLDAVRFNENVQKIVQEIPAFQNRLTSTDETPSVATLGLGETPKNIPNGLRFVMKFTSPQLTTIAQELHTQTTALPLQKAEAALEAPKTAAQPSETAHAETAANENVPAEASIAADAVASVEAPRTQAQPAQTSLVAANENTIPETTITAPAAEQSRLAEVAQQRSA